MTRPRLFLIDGHALCYRSFYAIGGLAASNGQPTNAVYGFVVTLRKILSEFSPDYLAACFDSPGRTKRKEKYEAYKIQRPVMPLELISQIPIIKTVVEAFGVGCYEKDGYEADDLMAALTRWAVGRKEWDVVIVTDDKDMFQLAGPHVSFLSPRKGVILGPADVAAQLGFEPQLTADFLSLAGDAADNIPGVSGIGKVTARKLINEFGGLAEIYRNIERVENAKLREKLLTGKERAFLSLELALLDDSVDFAADAGGLKVGEPRSRRLFEIFKELEFRRLAAEYGAAPPAGDGGPLPGLKVVTMEEGGAEFMGQSRRSGFTACCPEFSEDGVLSGVWVCAGGDPVVRWDPARLDRIFLDRPVTVVVHNLKSVLKSLGKCGIFDLTKTFDTLLAGYLLGSAQARLSIQDLAWDYLKQNIQDESPARLVRGLSELYPVMRDTLSDHALDSLLFDLEQPLARTLFEMEETGVALDAGLLVRLSAEAQERIDRLTAKMYAAAGGPFNVNSPKQLGKVLFEDLKLPVIRKTKTGFSTDEDVLNALAPQHELPALVLEYRQTAKLKSTYIDALPRMVDPATGRIHAVFDQAGTETGRLSSRQPNLQNIPIRAELGRQVRKAIIATPPDNVLLSADYSQIELRILAHLSGDRSLISAFEEGEDIHRFTAGRIFEIEPGAVDYLQRDTAKRVNFGIIYGMSAFGLAKDLKISQPQAQDFIDRYFLRYPMVKVFMDRTIAQCEQQGYVTTLLRRRRYIADINSVNPARRQYAQRQAINTPVQGSAADLIKLAMIRVAGALHAKKLRSRLIMTVHDELVFDAASGELDVLAPLVREIMEGALELSVPIRVNMKQGADWLDMKEVC
jgi:DNA polymerase-1